MTHVLSRLLVAVTLAVLSVTAAQATRPAGLVPVFARFHAFPTDEMLSADPRAAIGVFTFPAMMFYALPQTAGGCPRGTTMLFALVNTVTTLHATTADPSERVDMITNHNFQPDTDTSPDGNIGCIAVTGDDYDRVPLYRNEILVAGGSRYHYTTTAIESFVCMHSGTCHSSIVVGYVWSRPPAYLSRSYSETYVPLELAKLDPAKSGHIVKHSGDGETTVVPFPSGFRFPFYGVSRNSVKITTNGIATFNPTAENAADAAADNMALPVPWPAGSTKPHNFIAGWWDHSRMLDDKDYLWTWTGTAPYREFIVQWGRGTWANAARADLVRDMQMHFFETTGRVEIHYGAYGSPMGSDDTVDTATVGMGDPYGGVDSVFALVSCMPNCAKVDWPGNHVLAFMPDISGFVVTEKHPKDPADPKDPDAYVPLVEGAGAASTVGGSVVKLPLGFTFQFDGQNFSDVWVSAAGVLSFGAAPPAPIAAADRDIPGKTPNVIAPWWDDMIVDESDGKHHFLYQLTGSDPRTKKQVLTIEWQRLKHAGGKDPSERQMQVSLFEGTNEVQFYYGADSYSGGDGGMRYDSATAGVQNSTGDGGSVSFRLLECTPKCNEGRRGTTGPTTDGPNGPGGGRWPLMTRFLFTPDTQPGPTWHSVYWNYLMPATYTPTGVAPSAGHCGNCHMANFNHPEAAMLSHMFDPIWFPNITADCVFNKLDLANWSTPLLAFDGTGVFVSRDSALIAPNDAAVSWMTEPHGGWRGDEGNMPYDVHCKTDDLEANANDEAKSRLKRWILRYTP